MLVRLARVLGIQAGEGSPVAWLIVHSLFNGIFSALFLTAANALFLARFQIGMLPLAYIAASLVGYAAVALLSRLERHVRFGTLLLLNLGALLALASAFWVVRRFTDADWVVFLMFVVVGPTFNLIALGYWGLAGRLFDLRQGKRLFGLVGAGEEVSTIAGLFATPLIIRVVGGAGNLVPLAAIGLAGSFATVLFITRHFRAQLETGSGLTRARGESGMRFTDLLRVRYFVLMASSVVLLTLALYTIDFSFLAQVRLRFQGPGQIAQFFGVFYGTVKIVEFLMKVGVSGPLLSQFGLNVGLLVLPIVLSVSAALGIVVGTLGLGESNFFVLVALAKLVAVSGRTSTFEPSFRVLYQPLGPSERIVYQSHVEGTARQLSVGVVGLVLLLFSRNGAFNALALFYVLVPILGLWMVAAVLVHREYRVRLFEGLKGRAEPAAPPRASEVATAFLQSHPEADRVAAAQMIERIAPASLALADAAPATAETRLLLVRQLAVPRHAATAAAALAQIGPSIVPDLERAFGQGDQSAAVRRRIVSILGAIGGPDALSQLAGKIDSPDRAIRRRAIALLVAAGYTAGAGQAPQIERMVETLVRDMVWDMNVVLALQVNKQFDDVREALEAELAESRTWMFDLLSFLYDAAAVKGVKDITAGGSPQATVYALEILDLLVSPVLKPYVFAVVEGQSHLAVVRKLDALVTREHLTPYEALRALVRRDYGRIGMWTRALALDRLGRSGDGIAPDVVAFLFHPDQMLREVAAMRIAARDRQAWTAHRKRLAFDVREALEAVVTAGDADADADARSVFGRARLLGYVPGFGALAPEDRMALAASAELRALQPGQRLPAPRDPQYAFYVTLSGEVVLRDGDGTLLRLSPLSLFTFAPGAPPVEATAEALLVRLEPTLLFELAAEVPAILPGLLQAVDARRQYATS